jgi:hypothetical protein
VARPAAPRARNRKSTLNLLVPYYRSELFISSELIQLLPWSFLIYFDSCNDAFYHSNHSSFTNFSSLAVLPRLVSHSLLVVFTVFSERATTLSVLVPVSYTRLQYFRY